MTLTIFSPDKRYIVKMEGDGSKLSTNEALKIYANEMKRMKVKEVLRKMIIEEEAK